MAKVILDGKEYEFDELTDEAKGQVNSLQFVNNEIQKLEAQIAVCKTAQSAYTAALQKLVSD
mgnify:FL=1